MIRRIILASATLVAFVLAVPVTAQAQTLYFSAGAAFPSGDDLDFIDTGWLVAGGVTFPVGGSGLWAGVDGTYGSHGISNTDETVNTYSVMGILGYSFETQGSIDPYVWGGAGMQGVKIGDIVLDISESGFGWQGGAGVSIGGPDAKIRPFVEARYHSASIDIVDGEIDVKFLAAQVGVTIGLGN